MVLTGLVVLIAVVVLVVVAFHSGPHGLLLGGVGGAVGAIVAGILVVVAFGSASSLGWVLLGLAAAISVGAVGGGAAGLRRPSTSGGLLRSPVGREGVALSNLDPEGTVSVGGESWSARSIYGAIPRGATIHVAEANGLRLSVWSDQALDTGGDGLSSFESSRGLTGSPGEGG